MSRRWTAQQASYGNIGPSTEYSSHYATIQDAHLFTSSTEETRESYSAPTSIIDPDWSVGDMTGRLICGHGGQHMAWDLPVVFP